MSMWARHSASTPSAEHLTPSSHAWRAGAHSHTHTQQTAWTHVHAEEVGGGGAPTLRDGHILERPIAPHRLWVIRRGCSTQTIDGSLPPPYASVQIRAQRRRAPVSGLQIPRRGSRAGIPRCLSALHISHAQSGPALAPQRSRGNYIPGHCGSRGHTLSTKRGVGDGKPC